MSGNVPKFEFVGELSLDQVAEAIANGLNADEVGLLLDAISEQYCDWTFEQHVYMWTRGLKKAAKKDGVDVSDW